MAQPPSIHRPVGFYRDLIHLAPDAVYVHDMRGRILDANQAAARQTGFSLEQLKGMLVGQLVSDLSTEQVLARCRAIVENGESHRRFASTHRRADGTALSVEVSVTPVSGYPELLFAAVVRDLSERARLQTRLEHKVAFHELLLSISSRLVSLKPEQFDRTIDQVLAEIGRFFDVDRAYIFTVDEVKRVISNTHEWVSEGTDPVNSRLQDIAFAQFPWLMSHILQQRVAHAPDVDALPESARIDRIEYQIQEIRSLVIVPMVRRGRVRGMFGLDAVREKRFWSADIRENLRLLAQLLAGAMDSVLLSEQLRHRAYHDVLTELPNRQLLNDRISRGIHRARRNGNLLAVIMLDIDDFKLINDSMGHAAGDRLLRRVGQRIRGLVGEADSVGRLGGDEFVVVAELASVEEAAGLARRLVEVVSEPISLQDHPLVVHPSVGISLFPMDGDERESMLQNADTAMYAAKASGKNRYVFFDASMNEQARRMLELRYQLGRAIREQQLCLHYQPMVDLITGRVRGFEALVRWQHPELGLLLPAVFLPVAERSDLICQIDRWVVHRACQTAASLGLAEGQIISVNLAARNIYDPRQLGLLVEALSAQPVVRVSGIELEITESLLMQDIDHAISHLANLKQRLPGLRLAIDDFGSGYSSLNHLRSLPIDTLKLDSVFVRDISADSSNAVAIVRSIMELARNLGLHLVAEGVESECQRRALAGLASEQGVSLLAQGYWFSRPLQESELCGLLGEALPLNQ